MWIIPKSLRISALVSVHESDRSTTIKSGKLVVTFPESPDLTVLALRHKLQLLKCYFPTSCTSLTLHPAT
jgi:hypothetical protein